MKKLFFILCIGILISTGCATKLESTYVQTTNICNFDLSARSTSELCSVYWENKYPACDISIRNTLNTRGKMHSPPGSCGLPIALSTTAQVFTQPTCELRDIQSFTSQTTAALCTEANNGGECGPIAKLALQGRGLQTGNSNATCGSWEVSQCATLIQRLSSNPDPVASACVLRADKTSVAALSCRSAIAGLLLKYGKSSGLDGNQCGQPLSIKELKLHNK